MGKKILLILSSLMGGAMLLWPSFSYAYLSAWPWSSGNNAYVANGSGMVGTNTSTPLGVPYFFSCPQTTSSLSLVNSQLYDGVAGAQNLNLTDNSSSLYSFIPSTSTFAVNPVIWLAIDSGMGAGAGGSQRCGNAITISNSGGGGISFVHPTDGSTVEDFSVWQINISGGAGGYVQVNYSMGGLNAATDTSPVSDPSVGDVLKTRPLFFPPLLPPVLWDATATLYSSTSAAIALDHIQFSVNPPTGITSSTLASSTTNCSYTSSSFLGDPIGNIQTAICQAGVFLFIPNDTQQTSIRNYQNGQRTALASYPPFNAFFAVQTGLENATSTPTSTLTRYTGSGAFSGIFQTIRTIMVAIIWVFFAVGVIKVFNRLQT